MPYGHWTMVVVAVLSLSSAALAQQGFHVTEADLEEFPLKASARAKSRSADEKQLKKRAIDALLAKLDRCATADNPMVCAKKAVKDSDLDIPDEKGIGAWNTEVIPAKGNRKADPARK